MKNAANSITNAISIVLYCILHNTIQFKVVSIYGNIIAKPAGQLGQQGFACNANLYAQVPP